MSESHQDRVDRLFNSVKKQSSKEVKQARKKKKRPLKAAPKPNPRPSLGDTIRKIKSRHQTLQDI